MVIGSFVIDGWNFGFTIRKCRTIAWKVESISHPYFPSTILLWAHHHHQAVDYLLAMILAEIHLELRSHQDGEFERTQQQINSDPGHNL
jgi:hypothetical protein